MCPYASNVSSNLQAHEQVHSPDRPYKYIICKTCGKWFTSKPTLLKHRMWHHKSEFPPFRHNCNRCPYSSNVKTSLVNHEVVHFEDRPFKCKFCGCGFKALNSLNHHVIIHTGEKILYRQ
ncbi:Zinc finger protein 92 like protein [Argiope bruennichi]|uniref:Zinc finger protein 92 like protein n=1 Tax=Argiope bruennichi TaxID=94029 RepID=A0A8T0FR83_ARGBR|nr:Zinc finger protein 92 like protein [Argiope bruennichi]